MRDKIEARIKEYEAAIVKLVTDHTLLTGALSELKNILVIAEDVVEVIDPAAEPMLKMLDESVDAATRADEVISEKK